MTFKVLTNFNKHKRIYSTKVLLISTVVIFRLYTAFISTDETNTT